MKTTIQILILLALCSGLAFSQIPRTLSYQGVLTDSAGTPRADANYNFTFSLYDSGSGGVHLWSEAKSLQTKLGLFSTALGDVTPFPDSLKFDRPYWLSIYVEGIGELSPRIPLTSVGYSMNALRANTADVAGNLRPTDSNIAIGYDDYTHARLTLSSPHGNWLWLRQELNEGGGGGFFFHNPWKNGDPEERNRLEVAYKPSNGDEIWEQFVILGPSGNVGIGVGSPSAKLAVDTRGGTMPSLRLEHRGSNLIVRPTSAGGTSTIVENTSGGDLVFNPSYGNVGIGTSSPTSKLDVNGRTRTQVLEITGGSDLAEPFPVSEENQLEEGSVVVIDESNPGHVTLSREPYDKKVAGIVSGAGGIQPGLTLKQEGLMEGNQNIALSGRVYVKATASNGSIKPGDRLVTSTIPGLCMKATDPSRCDGAVIGKAMSALESGEGLVLVLVNLQ